MANQPSNKPSTLSAVLAWVKAHWKAEAFVSAFVLACVMGWIIWYNQTNNQLRPPIPGLPAAPVVSDLPKFMAGMQEAKSMCESRVTQLKKLSSGGGLPPADLVQGAIIYGDAKAANDACVTFLKAGLDRRFTKEDQDTIKKGMEHAGEKMMAFTAWADEKLNPKIVGAFNPLSEAMQYLPNFLKGVSEENEAAIKRFQEALDKCHFQDWDKIP